MAHTILSVLVISFPASQISEFFNICTVSGASVGIVQAFSQVSRLQHFRFVAPGLRRRFERFEAVCRLSVYTEAIRTVSTVVDLFPHREMHGFCSIDIYRGQHRHSFFRLVIRSWQGIRILFCLARILRGIRMSLRFS